MVATDDLSRMIDDACNPHRGNVDIGLNLDIAELVKQKPHNARLAAGKILKHVNNSEGIQSETICALKLLDMLVINCGYPMHLAISKKDFLNELVYKFPPNGKYKLESSSVRILGLIKKWVISLCEASNHRADFGNIRLMYNLLVAKKFNFPQIDEKDVQIMLSLESSVGTFKTKEEILQEERIVHEAKLDDYLCRGTPADLMAANELMKVMAGYDPDGYTNADSVIENELIHFSEKISVLRELIINRHDEDTNATIQTLYRECKETAPKLFRLANSDLKEHTMERLLCLTSELQETLKLLEEGELNGADAKSGTNDLLQLDKEHTHYNSNEVTNNDDLNASDESNPPNTLNGPNGGFFDVADILRLYNNPNTLNSYQSPISKLLGWNQDVVVDLVSFPDTQQYIRVLNYGGKPVEDLSLIFEKKKSSTHSIMNDMTLTIKADSDSLMCISYQSDGECRNLDVSQT